MKQEWYEEIQRDDEVNRIESGELVFGRESMTINIIDLISLIDDRLANYASEKAI